MSTENVKVFEEKEKKGLSIWAWLLPLLLLLVIALWFFSRKPQQATAAAVPVTEQTKPDTTAPATQVASVWTADSIANSIRSTGRVGFGDNDVHFATGSATLAGDSQNVLDQTAKALQANPDWRMQAVGNTDSTGSAAMNAKLAEQRASSVVAYLGSHGVDKSRLSIDTKGQEAPAATNSTAAGRAANRRVELIKQ